MRQISVAEATAVGGGACEDLTFTMGLTNISVSGSLGDWGSCATGVLNWAADTYNGIDAHLATGIPYAAAHVA